MKNESSRTAWCFNSCWAQEREVGHQASHPSTGPGEGSGATARSQARHEMLPQRPGSCTPVFLLLMLDMIFPRVLLQGWINFYEADCCFIIRFHSRWVQRAGKLSSCCQPALSCPRFLLHLLAQKPRQRDLGIGRGINAEDRTHAMRFQSSHHLPVLQIHMEWELCGTPFQTGTESKLFSM